MSEEITLNKTENREYRLPCGTCLGRTRHKVLQSVDVNGEDEGWDYDYVDNYQIVQCQGCDSISFRKGHSDSENTIYDEENDETIHIETTELYPSRVAGRHKLRQAHFLPEAVARIYNETHSALSNKQPILSGVGIRALVETVCNEKKAAGYSLESKIDDLVTKGVLTQTGAETLHSMRILGNEAAHEVKPHSEQTLNLAMDVVEHLLNDVYVLPAATKALPKRNTTPTSTSAQAPEK
jgi:hypothetical protein